MDCCQSIPRPALKGNSPATRERNMSVGTQCVIHCFVYVSLLPEKVLVPPFRRYKLFGAGGYKMRNLTEETGVYVCVCLCVCVCVHVCVRTFIMLGKRGIRLMYNNGE